MELDSHGKWPIYRGFTYKKWRFSMVMLNNQMVSLKVSWEISMSLIQHQQADSPRRFSWWPIAWEKDQFSPVTSAVVMWSQKKGLGKPSDISMSLSFCHKNTQISDLCRWWVLQQSRDFVSRVSLQMSKLLHPRPYGRSARSQMFWWKFCQRDVPKSSFAWFLNGGCLK